MIIPGILETSLEEIANKIRMVENFTSIVQIDIADGELVEGASLLNLDEILNIETDLRLDIHLMVKNPTKYLEEPSPKIERICAQIEGSFNPTDWLRMAKDKGYKAGISLNPETPVERVENIVSQLDYIQFMTVKPGGQGREFNEEVINKIKKFREKFPSTPVEVDGGINKKTIKPVLKAGTNDVVIGSAIFGTRNPKKAYRKFERIYKKYGI